MNRRRGTATRSSTLAGLADPAAFAALTAEEAARLLAEALAGGDGPLAAEEGSRLAVSALQNSRKLDEILAGLELELLAGALTRLLDGLGTAPSVESRQLVWSLLDLLRRPAVLRRVPGSAVEAWSALFLRAVDASQLTVGPLFRQRAARNAARVLFQIPRYGGYHHMTWRSAAARVALLARGLHALDEGSDAPLALLCENRLEMALLDLACLTSGRVNVMVPANSTDADVRYILGHSGVRTVVVSDRVQLEKVLRHRESLSGLRNVVALFPVALPGVLPLDAVLALAEQVPEARIEERSLACTVDDLATVMYTSGTTGTPKGIQFTHRNLVFKRFARGLALPEIGEDDVFLCFLPLFHTFGRFFELMGCVYWGARYCFMGSTSVEEMVQAMRRCRPSVFISVPKKWIQLYEVITREADPFHATDEQLLQATQRATGGNLRWGLSAAGHLDPDVFRLFQRQAVMLLSGFGMTEATGGISMTRPGEYRDESLGTALPGIEMRLADDGELLVRGPYVMRGYLDPPEGQTGFDDQGWFHTGDLMQMDEAGHIRLVDRKKEIYKNIKGETIAPQPIENHFRDFDSVGRAFLVGDHREYNTLLIYPNPHYKELDFAAMSAAEIWDHFRSLVVSVNKFLAPYERIVDFAVVDRDLDEGRGELTPKGTPRRLAVVRNFAETIRLLYRRANLHVGGVELIFPNWLFQTLGLTTQDVRVEGDTLLLTSLGRRLIVRRESEQLARVGSCSYRHSHQALNLGSMLNTPQLWLGNEELTDFVPLELSDRQRLGRTATEITWQRRVTAYAARPADAQRMHELLQRKTWQLPDVDFAARALVSDAESLALDAVRLLREIVQRVDGALVESALLVLSRGDASAFPTVCRRAFQALVPGERKTRFRETLGRFLQHRPEVLNDETNAALCELTLDEAKLEAFVEVAQRAATAGGTSDPRKVDLAQRLLRLLAAYGAGHPTSYRRLRAFLARTSRFAVDAAVRKQARAAGRALLAGFRRWMGENSRIAVDPETGREYRWDDVVAFHEEVPEADRRRILDAIKKTPFLREAAFLFSNGVLIRLSDVPPGGVWVRPLGASHGKAVYRITVQTRFQGHHDLAVNVNHDLTPQQVREEIRWLILSGDGANEATLVEEFGGYWREQDLWSEEFIAGETLARALKRLAARPADEERLKQLWPFLAWTALSAYVDFWHRSGRRWEIADPGMTNVVVPTDDYHTGVRIVSVSARRPHRGLLGMLASFVQDFINPAEKQYPQLDGLVGWDVVFSSILEIVGEDEGLALLRELLVGAEPAPPGPLRQALEAYVARIEVRGFLPRRLFFAAKRYRRWERLSDEPTPQARARTLQELYETYGLQRLIQDYPEARVRFFRETVFRHSPESLTEGLERLIDEVRRGQLLGDEWIDAVADLRSKLSLGSDDDYFLARLSLPYLRPEDAAGFVRSRSGGQQQSDIVVGIEDQDGNAFRVRHALNPKEIGRLHRIFLAAKLEVHFLPEHRYLVAINDRAQIVAGIYYAIEAGGQSAHLEKIVVTERLRGKGVADGLMRDFFNRLRAAGVKTVTTGFFRPEYFYAYGFRIEKKYAGLVKSLDEPAAADEPRG